MRVGRYNCEYLISKGGMGEVYLGSLKGEAGFNKQVVIKLIKAEYASNGTLRKQFVKEATLSAKLSHQNVIQVFDFGFEEDRPYLIMEYVEGVTLREIIDSGIAISESMVASILLQILIGLEEAYNNNIIHRDLSPSNILINKNGVVKIADFGLAKQESEPESREIWGKLDYIAPEVINGERADYLSDLYSIGKVGKELIGEKEFKILNCVKSFLLEKKDRPKNYSYIMEDLRPFSTNGIEELEKLVLSLMSNKTLKQVTKKIVGRTNRFPKKERILMYAVVSFLLIIITFFGAKGIKKSTLNLNVTPWAYVYINGSFSGETPLLGKKLSSGMHKILFTNPELNKRKQIEIQLEPGKEENLLFSF